MNEWLSDQSIHFPCGRSAIQGTLRAKTWMLTHCPLSSKWRPGGDTGWADKSDEKWDWLIYLNKSMAQEKLTLNSKKSLLYELYRGFTLLIVKQIECKILIQSSIHLTESSTMLSPKKVLVMKRSQTTISMFEQNRKLLKRIRQKMEAHNVLD